MKVGIIGSGIVGRVLATAFLKEGHQVMLGSRYVSKAEVVKWLAENPTGQAGDFSNTTIFGELVVIAVKGSIALNAVEICGVDNFNGKTVIDATNPIAELPPVNGVLQFFTGPNESLFEKIQTLIPQANLVKSFSCVGNAFMYKPDFNGVQPTMFICGNNEASKQTVTSILTAFGWETADMGKQEAARAIEPLCMLWCIPGMVSGQWSHAFKLLKK
jgi:hypothetical protein